jgi:hypothetical protein
MREVTLVVNDPETGKRMEDINLNHFYGLKRISVIGYMMVLE